MNQVVLVGRTTKDLVLRSLATGHVQAMFTLAITRSFKNNEADFVQCIAWGKLAEHIVKYCGKGPLIGVKGRLQTGSYVKNDHQKVYTMNVVAEEVRFLALKPANAAYQPLPDDFVLPEQESELVQQL